MRLLVTGAASEVGSFIASVFESNGHFVLRHDTYLGDGIGVACDLFDRSLQPLADSCDAWKIGTVVAAHGLSSRGALSTVVADDFERAIRRTSVSTMNLHSALRAALKRGVESS